MRTAALRIMRGAAFFVNSRRSVAIQARASLCAFPPHGMQSDRRAAHPTKNQLLLPFCGRSVLRLLQFCDALLPFCHLRLPLCDPRLL